MSKHLLAIALGPIQDFIAAARRTRDLWFGSFLLSEISKATARTVLEQGGELIFPNPTYPDTPDRINPECLKQGSDFNVANIILAELRKDLSPKDIAATAKIAATGCWKLHANTAKQEAAKIIELDRWQGQIEDVLEFYAAWMPLERDDKYAETRQQLMRLLAGRKALRDFKLYQGHAGIPKSSLDGARESVLKPRDQRREALRLNKPLAQRLRLLPGEELDILGLTKRCATKEAFASVVRVAADPWIRGIAQDGGEARITLDKIGEECQKVFDYKDENTPHATGSGLHYKDSAFRYDGSVLFPSRLAGMLRPARDGLDLLDREERDALDRIRDRWLPKLQKHKDNQLGYGEPEPYLAVLVADGDRMGKTLSAIGTPDRHRAFSRQLAQFAGEARKTIGAHQGCLVYAGGDDVLAFVPVDRCLDCARKLHDDFAGLLDDFKDGKGQKPSLSVGIAIGHCIEPLEDLLDQGRQAEKSAKHPDRDGLAVSLHTRGGAPVHVRAQWARQPDRHLLKWVGMHLAETLSDQAVFGLRRLAVEYAAWPKTPGTDEAIRQDIARLFSRKQAGGEALDTQSFAVELAACFDAAGHDPQAVYQGHHPGILRLANEWIIARKIASVMRQAQGKQEANP